MNDKWPRASSLFVLLLILSPAGRPNQPAEDKCIFLVAERNLPNPLFEKSVILMLPRKDAGVVVGLIVNKPSQVAMRDLFPDDSALKKATNTVYFGGPVDTGTASILFRASKPQKQAFQIQGDLYVTFDKDLIKSILKKPDKVLDARLFLGRSQWRPGQLQDEMSGGSWFTDHDDSSVIFKSDAASVWPALIDRLDPGSVVRWNRDHTPRTRLSIFQRLKIRWWS